MDPDQAFKPWPTPERELPGLRHRSWLYYTGVTLAVVAALMGLALVAFVILAVISLNRSGNNK